MKRFKYTYCLWALLGMAMASCESVLDTSEIESNTQINLTMNFSDTKAGETENEYTYPEERYINDIAVYLFDATTNRLIEKVANPKLSGQDGDVTRTIYGVLEADYSTHTSGIDVVVLTNLTARGLTAPNYPVGTSKTELYTTIELHYSYTQGDAWRFQTTPKQYIPMYGEALISEPIKKGVNNGGEVYLYRAIARVDVVFNGGDGFDHFDPTSLTITRYNSAGSCATQSLDATNIPSGTTVRTDAPFFQPVSGNKGTYRIYIPEYKNTGSGATAAQVKLTGKLNTAGGSTTTKTYTMDFKFAENGTAIKDILRNNLYIFNITSIANEVDVTTGIKYEVEQWTPVTVNIPTFN